MSDINEKKVDHNSNSSQMHELVINLLSRPADIDKLINDLDSSARDYDGYEYGLPTHEGDHLFKMRMIILEWLKDL